MIQLLFSVVCFWLMMKIAVSMMPPTPITDYEIALFERKLAYRRAGKRLVME